MKESITIKLHQETDENYPSWQELIEHRTEQKFHLAAGVDSILKENKVPVWVTNEYNSMKKGGWTTNEVKNGFNRIYRLILQEDKKIPEGLIQKIALLPDVEYVRPLEFVQTKLPHYLSDSMVESQKVFSNNETVVKNAHQYSKGLKEIKIAVLDTGIYGKHDEFSHGNVAQGKDFVNIIDGQKKFVGDFLGVDDSPDDEVGHGTHVAGIIGARGKSMRVGLVPNCKIIPVKVLGAFKRGNSVVGAGTIGDINAGIKYAVDQKVDIINMSLGIKHEGGGLPHAEVIEYAKSEGVTIVAASGNDGTRDRYFPGANPHVIAVGATDLSGGVAGFSTYGAHISYVAPGTNIYSTYLENKYAFSNGTSQASPFVAGAIALLQSYAIKKMGRKLSDSKIKKILLATADRGTSNIKTTKEGFGAINLIDALKLLNYQLN